jgi:hypothetical protein
VGVAERSADNSVLVIVQFPQRNADRVEIDLNYRAERLREKLIASENPDWSVYWIAQKKGESSKVGDLAFFVLAPRPGPAEKIENLLVDYAKRHNMRLSTFG